MTHLCIFKASNRFWGYEQYPQNHLDIYRKLNSEAKRIGSNERILIHRKNNLLHYAYIRNLGYGQKIGIGLTDDRMFKDINSLFVLFRTLSEELAKEELILKNRKASNQYKLSGESLTDRQTQIKLNIFINKISVYLGKQFAGTIKLPPASLTIAREDIVIDSLQRRDSDWFIERIKEGYHNIYISLRNGEPIKLSVSLVSILIILLLIVMCMFKLFKETEFQNSKKEEFVEINDTIFKVSKSLSILTDTLKAIVDSSKQITNIIVSDVEGVAHKPSIKDLTNKERFRNAINRKEWNSLKELADDGYSPAYLPLAKYYMENANQHKLAYKYALKAKKVGILDAENILKELEDYDF